MSRDADVNENIAAEAMERASHVALLAEDAPDDPRTPVQHRFHRRYMALSTADHDGMDRLCSDAIAAEVERLEISISEAHAERDAAFKRNDASYEKGHEHGEKAASAYAGRMHSALRGLLEAATEARWPLTAEQMLPMNEARAALKNPNPSGHVPAEASSGAPSRDLAAINSEASGPVGLGPCEHLRWFVSDDKTLMCGTCRVTKPRDEQLTGLLPCPFCGSTNIDPEEWASLEKSGPGCDDCGACAETVKIWNTRVEVLTGLKHGE